jgi:hypothetical protein
MSRARKIGLIVTCLAAGPFFPLVLIGFVLGRERPTSAHNVVRLADVRPPV